MLISVVMPAKNRGEMIRDSIQSIINQTWTDWELVVVDDHSSQQDTTEATVNSFDDSRIKFYRLPDENGHGIAAARNYGSVMSEGDVVAVLDSDDVSYPERLELTAAAFEKRQADIVYGIAEYWNEANNETVRPEGTYAPRDFDLEALKESNYIAHSTVAYKRQLALDFPYNTFFRKGEDYDFYGRLAKYDFKFHFIDKPLTKYRVHENSVIREISQNFSYTEKLHQCRGWQLKDETK